MTAQTADVPTTEPVEAVPEDLHVLPEPDLDVILPPPGQCMIGEIECSIKRLKAREFFAVIGIITNGMGPGLSQVDFRSQNAEELQGKLAMVLVMAIPNAMHEFLSLVQGIVSPVDDRHAVELRHRLADPEIEDLLPVIDTIITQEIDDLWQLVGKARAYLTRWQETFKKQRSSPSPARST